MDDVSHVGKSLAIKPTHPIGIICLYPSLIRGSLRPLPSFRSAINDGGQRPIHRHQRPLAIKRPPRVRRRHNANASADDTTPSAVAYSPSDKATTKGKNVRLDRFFIIPLCQPPLAPVLPRPAAFPPGLSPPGIPLTCDFWMRPSIISWLIIRLINGSLFVVVSSMHPLSLSCHFFRASGGQNLGAPDSYPRVQPGPSRANRVLPISETTS